MKVNFSSFFNLNWQDLLKGAIVAVATVVVGGLYAWVSSDPVHFPNTTEFVTLLKTGGLAGIAYLLKNLFTPPPSTVVVDRSKTDVEYKKP